MTKKINDLVEENRPIQEQIEKAKDLSLYLNHLCIAKSNLGQLSGEEIISCIYSIKKYSSS